jgi:hypothetical protein
MFQRLKRSTLKDANHYTVSLTTTWLPRSIAIFLIYCQWLSKMNIRSLIFYFTAGISVGEWLT